MARNFTISTPAETVRTGAGNRGEMVFTVTNVSGVATRGMARIVALGDTRAEWLSLTGDLERELAQGGVQQFTVVANVPAGTAPGRYPWRFDVVAGAKSGEEHEAGPVVAFEVPATEAPKRSRWWLWIAVAALLVVAGVVVALMMRRPKLVEVPDVGGATQQQAEEKLRAAGFVPKVRTVRVLRAVPRVVRDQDPKAGQQAEEGATVTITLPARLFRPDVAVPKRSVKQP